VIHTDLYAQGDFLSTDLSKRSGSVTRLGTLRVQPHPRSSLLPSVCSRSTLVACTNWGIFLRFDCSKSSLPCGTLSAQPAPSPRKRMRCGCAGVGRQADPRQAADGAKHRTATASPVSWAGGRIHTVNADLLLLRPRRRCAGRTIRRFEAIRRGKSLQLMAAQGGRIVDGQSPEPSSQRGPAAAGCRCEKSDGQPCCCCRYSSKAPPSDRCAAGLRCALAPADPPSAGPA